MSESSVIPTGHGAASLVEEKKEGPHTLFHFKND